MAKASAHHVNLSDVSIEEKVGQMIIVKANEGVHEKFLSLGIGGIFLNGGKTSNEFKKIIDDYQTRSKLLLFVSTDLEGYWNPFLEYTSTSFGDIRTGDEARMVGEEHAQKLKEAGFNIDFSPVVESKNKVWRGRSFEGNFIERKEKIEKYIAALQENNIRATAKHYPGGSMEKNPHWRLVKAKIDKEDLENFDVAIKAGVGAIMVGHAIVEGELDSHGKPATTSPEVIAHLRRDFSGLIMTDDISMLGLRLKYLFKRERMCIDLIKAGNDIIVDSWKTKPNHVEKCVRAIVNAVKSGEISEDRINESAKRILEAKGYLVVE